MNAAEIHTEVSKVMRRAIAEGIAPEDGKPKVGFETVIGILESAKQSLYDWKAMRQAMAAQQQENGQHAPLIIPFDKK